MATSYNKLFKLLIDKGMKKGELCDKACIGKSSLDKMNNSEHISTSILERVCAAINGDYGDVIDDRPDKAPDEVDS
jgi:DNA-binding Xre family transcriptional regulator